MSRHPRCAATALYIACAAIAFASAPLHGQRPGHMPDVVRGSVLRHILTFSPIRSILPDSGYDVYVDPVPRDFMRLELPPGVRPAAAVRNALGRAAFIESNTPEDSLLPRLRRHVESLGWVRREYPTQQGLRAPLPGEGIYCRHGATLLITRDTSRRGFVTLARLAPMLSPCAPRDTGEHGEPLSLVPKTQPPMGFSRASSGSSSSGAEEDWRSDITVKKSLADVDTYYSASFAKGGLLLGPPSGDSVSVRRTVQLTDRFGTVWKGSYTVTLTNKDGSYHIAVRLLRELEPEER